MVDTLLNKTTVFSYTGDSQEYEVPKDGYYYIEMAGAEGGSAKYSTSYSGGKGAKTSGYVHLDKGETLYFYVGGMGSSHSGTTTDNKVDNGNGYNGGGQGNFYANNSSAGGGGGATDVRLVSNEEAPKYRYVRNYINGSSVNTGNHWVEIEVYSTSNQLLSTGKTITHNGTSLTYGGTATSLKALTDGDTTSANYVEVRGTTNPYIEIDLGQEYDIGRVKVWHYYNDGRIYNNNKIELLTSDKTESKIVFDSDTEETYQETRYGKTVYNIYEKSLISRIMVAAGGGGADSHTKAPNYSGYGGSGGALFGGDALQANTYCYQYGTGGTQISGGQGPNCENGTSSSYYLNGQFGIGNNNGDTSGGGGYYGGGGGHHGAAAGGSSYISGYAGVNSVEESATITHTNQTLHYSGKYFIGGKMLEGQNEGNGYAKITYVGTKPEKKTTKLDNVRYIKNCIYGNTNIDDNHWVEVQAIKDGVNIAKGKSVTGNYSARSDRPYTLITDGDLTSDKYATTVNSGSNEQITGFVNECITVDLGKEYDLDELAIWNLTYEQRRYYDNITSVSSDNKEYTEVIDEASIETSNGHRINAYTDTYNGYIQDDLVLWYDGYANTGTIRNAFATTWKDLSGTGNDVTINGATWNYNYLSFDGVNDYAYKTSGAVYNITKEHTIEVLFKPEKIASSYQSIFNTVDSGTGVSQYGSLWITSGNQLRYETADGSANNLSQGLGLNSDDVNKKYLMTNIRDDKTYKTYNQGNLIKEDITTWNARTPNPAIYIGKAASYYFQGKIYSIRVYNKALTEDEILHNYLYDVEKFNIE